MSGWFEEFKEMRRMEKETTNDHTGDRVYMGAVSGGVSRANIYCDAVQTIFEKLIALRSGLRIAALTAVSELLADEP